jgi:hypothetical protein
VPAEPLEGTNDADQAHAEAREAFDAAGSRLLRRVLLALSILMAVAGLVMLFLPLPMRAIGFYVLIFAAAPAGIALGTQERAFYA